MTAFALTIDAACGLSTSQPTENILAMSSQSAQPEMQLDYSSNDAHAQGLHMRQDSVHLCPKEDLGTVQAHHADGGGVSGDGSGCGGPANVSGQANVGGARGHVSDGGVLEGVGSAGVCGGASRGHGGASRAIGVVGDTQAARQLRARLFERPAPVLVAALEQLETIVRGDDARENGVDADAGCAVSLGATKAAAPAPGDGGAGLGATKAAAPAPGDGGAGAGASTCIPSSSSTRIDTSTSTSIDSSAKASASKSTSSSSAGGLAAVQCAEWVGRMWLETGVPHSELMGAKHVDINLTCR
jgi:hypothetical protein